jgi:hypothetical protein
MRPKLEWSIIFSKTYMSILITLDIYLIINWELIGFLCLQMIENSKRTC